MGVYYTLVVKGDPNSARNMISNLGVELKGITWKKYVCAPIGTSTIKSSAGDFGAVIVNLANPKEAGGFFADIVGWGTSGWLPQEEGEAKPQDIEKWLGMAKNTLGDRLIDIEPGMMTKEDLEKWLIDHGYVSVVQAQVTDSDTTKKNGKTGNISKYLPLIILGAGVVALAFVLKR